MSKLFWRPTSDGWRTGDNGTVDAPADFEVTEQHPLPVQLGIRGEGTDEFLPLDDGNPLPVRFTDQPASVRASDWRQRAVYLGYGGHVTIGAQASPITGGGNGTVIDPEQPEGLISVASGYTLVPLRITVQCHVPLLNADSDASAILVAVDRLAAWDGTGTATTETIFPMYSNAGAGGLAGATARSAFTADTATPTLDMELDRSVITADLRATDAGALWTPLALLYEPTTSPLIKGPACLYLFWYGTAATTGYAQVQFLSVPNTILPSLL